MISLDRLVLAFILTSAPIALRYLYGDPSWHYLIGPSATTRFVGVYVVLTVLGWLTAKPEGGV